MSPFSRHESSIWYARMRQCLAATVLVCSVAMAKEGSPVTKTSTRPSGIPPSCLTLTLEGLIPNAKGRSSLTFPLFCREGVWCAGAGSGSNRAYHRIEAKNLTWDVDKLDGRIEIVITPDPWMPVDGKSIRGEVSIQGEQKDGALNGTYEGTMGETPVTGQLKGVLDTQQPIALVDSHLTITIPDVWDMPGDRRLPWVVLTMDVTHGKAVHGEYGPFRWHDNWIWERYEPERCDLSGLKIGSDTVRGNVRLHEPNDGQREYELNLDLFSIGDQLTGECAVSPGAGLTSSPVVKRTVKGTVSLPSPTMVVAEPESDRISGKVFLAEVEHIATNNAAKIPPDRYKLWIADKTSVCRAVVVFIGHAEGRLFGNPRWRAEAAKMGCGLVMCYPGGGKSMGDNAIWVLDGRAGHTLSGVLDQFATVAKHPELHFAPWVVWGISWSADNAYMLACRESQRTLACISYHGYSEVTGYGFPAGFTASAPTLFVNNSKEQHRHIVSCAYAQFVQERRHHAIRSYLCQKGGNSTYEHGHIGNDAFLLAWIGSMLDMRLPTGDAVYKAPVVLNDKVTDSDGFLAGFDGEIATSPEFKGDKARASWFPNRNLAEWWNRERVPIPDAMVKDGEKELNKEVGKDPSKLPNKPNKPSEDRR